MIKDSIIESNESSVIAHLEVGYPTYIHETAKYVIPNDDTGRLLLGTHKINHKKVLEIKRAICKINKKTNEIDNVTYEYDLIKKDKIKNILDITHDNNNSYPNNIDPKYKNINTLLNKAYEYFNFKK